MIGVSCTHFCSEPISSRIESVSREFGLWEIFSEADHDITVNTEEVGQLLSSYDLRYSLHSPICDLNVAAMSDRLREASIQEIVSNAVAANRLDIRTMTVHPGLASMAVNGLEDRATERAKLAMRFFDKVSKEYGVTMAIENMPVMPFFLGRTAASLAEIVEGTDLGICFDIGHANTAGQIDEMVSTFGDRIVNVHIHDNNGSKDEHLTIGDGNIDFGHVLGLLKHYGGNYVIESRTLESAEESQRRLSQMLS